MLQYILGAVLCVCVYFVFPEMDGHEPYAYIRLRLVEAREARRAHVRGYLTSFWLLAVIMTACVAVAAVLRHDYRFALATAAVAVGVTLLYAAAVCVHESACAPRALPPEAPGTAYDTL
jgi:hypothetical protein